MKRKFVVNLFRWVIVSVVCIVLIWLAIASKDKSGSLSTVTDQSQIESMPYKENTRSNDSVNVTSSNGGVSNTERGESALTDDKTTIESIDPIVGNKHSFKDLKIRGIGKKDNIYVGLQYVKKMPYLPTKYGDTEVPYGSEVIIAFFECYNSGRENTWVSLEDITCYADGKIVTDVGTLADVIVDGIPQFSLASLDKDCRVISAQDFEVRSGWKELKFFYESECIWTVSEKDVSENDYAKMSLFDIENIKANTDIDSVIYSDGYTVWYKGVEYIYDDGIWGDRCFAAIKCHIENNNNSKLEVRPMINNIRAYHHFTYLKDADQYLDNKLDGYLNVVTVDSIEPGMSCDVYWAFEVEDESGDLYFLYDDNPFIKRDSREIYVEESEAEVNPSE